MTLMYAAFASHWAAFTAQALLSIAWKGTLLACCVALCLRVLPGVSAAARSIVWVATLLVLLALPLLHGHAIASLSAGPIHKARIEAGMQWAWFLVAAWALAAAIRFVQLLRSAWYVRHVARSAKPVDPAILEAHGLYPLYQAAGRSIQLCASDQIGIPCVAGFFSPKILVPPHLLETLSSADLRRIIQHEAEHIRRRDDWVNLLQKCSLVLFPLSPGLWWVERRLCAERELACDDRVLQQTGTPKAYAVCLANLAEQSLMRRSASLVLGAWRRRSELARRIHRILSTPAASWSRSITAAVVAGLVAAVSAGAFALEGTSRLINFQDAAPVDAGPANLTASLRPPASGPTLGWPVAAASPTSSSSASRAVLVSAHVSSRPASSRPIASHPKSVASPSIDLALAPAPRHPRSSETLITWHKPIKPRASQQDVRPEDFHFTYAAIPVPDGWLIVQL